MKLTDELYSIIDDMKIKIADENHPVFKAHFPTMPVLPGFLQIDIAQALLDKQFTMFKKVKFIHPIKPNDIIEYSCENKKVIIKKDETKMSEFIYE